MKLLRQWPRIALALALTACQSRPSDLPKSLPAVRAEPVREATSHPCNRYAGVVRANAQVEMDFKVSGYVKMLSTSAVAPGKVIQEGDRVRAGATLAVVDPADYWARVETATAAVSEARAAAEQAGRDQLRAQMLVDRGAVASVELERGSAQRDVSQARLARAEATLHEAQLSLADTALRAPFSGVVLARMVEKGAFVSARTPAFVLADDTTMKVAFGVPDSVMPTLQIGGAANVEVPSLGKHFVAHVSRIAPAADARSRVFEVEVSIPNPDQELKVGLAASVVFDETTLAAKGSLVPLRALVRGSRSASDIAVYTVSEPGPHVTVHARNLDLLRVIGDDALVLGLNAEQRIVTVGASFLHDGDAVQLAP